MSQGRNRKRAAGSFARVDLKREYPQIVARFDRETFDQVAAIAARNGWSFNGTLCLLVEWGLEEWAEGGRDVAAIKAKAATVRNF